MMGKRILPWVKTGGQLALLSYLAVAAGLFAAQRWLIFPGRGVTVSREVPRVEGMQAWRVSTQGGLVDAFFFPPLTAGEHFPVMVFGHGNGEVIDQWLHGLDEIRRWGMAVLLVEYPGYGRSAGSPSEQGVREAMVGAYDRLLQESGVDRARIVGYGQSLGGGAICALAAERPLAAMILQSTFTTIATFARRYAMPAALVLDPFDNRRVVEGFAGPILLMHGRHDELIPLDQAETLAAHARHAELHVYECGHYCWFPDRLPILADMRNFLTRAEVLGRS